jgi:hypothetical protein
VLALGAGLALPAAALGAAGTTAAQSTPQVATQPVLPGTSNPLSPEFPQPSVSTPTTTAPPVAPLTTSATAGGGSGFSGSSAIIIAIGALVVLGGISLFIWRDARRRAPVRHRTVGPDIPGEGRRKGSKQRAKPRKLSPAERRRRKRGRAR